ncbi:helix-turn-helix domain-containing protein [Flexivirga aerilata]|uniref:helix-turn-helix domain-containing protein n=1 Tax=Flexivirga aerilata TaxID=1656889 RepID=UPI003CCDBB21
MNARYAEPWTVHSLAAHTGVSASTLAREFLAVIGTTPAAYLRGRRILEAKRLLRESSHPLESIAVAVGYTSAVGLHQAFARECGETPGAFRNRSRST